MVVRLLCQILCCMPMFFACQKPKLESKRSGISQLKQEVNLAQEHESLPRGKKLIEAVGDEKKIVSKDQRRIEVTADKQAQQISIQQKSNVTEIKIPEKMLESQNAELLMTVSKEQNVVENCQDSKQLDSKTYTLADQQAINLDQGSQYYITICNEKEEVSTNQQTEILSATVKPIVVAEQEIVQQGNEPNHVVAVMEQQQQVQQSIIANHEVSVSSDDQNKATTLTTVQESVVLVNAEEKLGDEVNGEGMVKNSQDPVVLAEAHFESEKVGSTNMVQDSANSHVGEEKSVGEVVAVPSMEKNTDSGGASPVNIVTASSTSPTQGQISTDNTSKTSPDSGEASQGNIATLVTTSTSSEPTSADYISKTTLDDGGISQISIASATTTPTSSEQVSADSQLIEGKSVTEVNANELQSVSGIDGFTESKSTVSVSTADMSIADSEFTTSRRISNDDKPAESNLNYQNNQENTEKNKVKNKKSQQEIATFLTNIEKLTQDIKELKLKLKTLKDLLGYLHKQNTSLNQDIEEASKNLAKNNGKKTDDQSKSELEDELKRLKNTRTVTLIRIGEAQSEIDELREKIRSLRYSRKELRKSLNETKDEAL